MSVRIVLLVLLLTTTSGCYLVHERADPIDAAVPDAFVIADAGRDAFRPRDTGTDAPRPDAWAPPEPHFCPLTTACPYDHAIMLSRVARAEGDANCETFDFDVHGTDACASPSLVRVAIMRCVGRMTWVNITATRVTGPNTMTYTEHGPGSCGCTIIGVVESPEVGTSFGHYLSEDDEEGVVEYAVSGQDMSFHVEACAF